MLNDSAAERGVLSGMCRYGSDAYLDVNDIVDTNTFTVPYAQVVFSCLEHFFKTNNTKPDYPSILSSANALGLSAVFQENDAQQYLRAILNSPVEQSNVRILAGKIKKLQATREICELYGETRQKLVEEVTGNEPFEQIIAMAENPIFELTTKLNGGDTGGAVLLGDGMEELFRFNIENPRDLVGIPTGFNEHDKYIGGGLRQGGVALVGGRQKSGKSQFGHNVGLYIARAFKIPVLIVDTEMEADELRYRVGACISGVETLSIETGKVKLEDQHTIYSVAKEMREVPFYYESVRGLKAEEILARIRRWVFRKVGLDDKGKAKPCVIIYDYLKLMNPGEISKNFAEHQLLGFMSSGLKNLAGRYNLAVLCFAQLNRDALDYDDTRVLRGSDRILDDVTSFSIYRWKFKEERSECGVQGYDYTHKLLPVISRFGPAITDGDYINIKSDYSRSRISEGPLNSVLLKDTGSTGLKKKKTQGDEQLSL